MSLAPATPLRPLSSNLDRSPSREELLGKLAAIDRSQAVIEFDLEGNILTANENFLEATGYRLEEIKGQHHRIFADPEYAKSEEYRKFWQKLGRGDFDSGEYKRVTKDGSIIWIQATYNPILDSDGKPVKIVKFATDITESKLKNAEYEGKIDAISKSQAMIEFNLDGTIITANDNFLQTLGYSLPEIQGKHHQMFATPEYASSEEYQLFWQKLRQGEFDSGQYKRLGKDGKEIWIQASYNPILDTEGKPFKVVKFATDITKEKLAASDAAGQLNAIDKALAVIEFNMDGTIITANKNFTDTVGYELDEIRGQHHRIFCDPDYANSKDYRDFWRVLNEGRFDSGQYRRISKAGEDIYIQASYNPILDLDGRPYKVVKYATNLTEEKKAYINLVDSFGKESTQLMAAAEELSATAGEMAKAAKGTSEQSDSAAAASHQVAQGVNDVAASTEEMSASIQEIAQGSEEASAMSLSAKEQATQANTTVSQLGEASLDIGNVIKVISSIAQQTNLLALNATIEAARAGDAGKGFAVVANEVKELAKQTAMATEDITKKIANVQNTSQEAASAIGDINSAIDKLNEIATQTAAAVSEQTATTAEVTRILNESRSGVSDISETIKTVADYARNGAAGAEQTLNAARSLSDIAVHLTDLVESARAR